MSRFLRGIVIFSLLLSLSNAESNSTAEYEISYIDKTHKRLSETVIEWSEKIDTMVSNWLEDNETNVTSVDINNTTENQENSTFDNEINSTTTDDINTTTDHVINTTSDPKTNTSSVSPSTGETKRDVSAVSVPVVRASAFSDVPVSETAVATNVSENTLEDRVKSTDSFFQSEKYLNETDNTYVRVRVENYFQSKESNDIGLTLRAQMPFKKSRKNLKIFLDNMTLDNANEILNETNEAPDIGIRYFKLEKMIKSRYSIGFRGIDPFVRARYNMPIQTDNWLIDMVQSFKYSLDDKFEEETNIYFDKEVGKESLLRVQLYRKTQEDLEGMHYALFLQYYRSLSKHTGYGFTQAFIGNTKYEYTVDNGIEPPQTEQFSGINNYVTSFSWRTNIWRKWFFVEVRPSVSFDKRYDYEPNYRVLLFFDFYFGKFN